VPSLAHPALTRAPVWPVAPSAAPLSVQPWLADASAQFGTVKVVVTQRKRRPVANPAR